MRRELNIAQRAYLANDRAFAKSNKDLSFSSLNVNLAL